MRILKYIIPIIILSLLAGCAQPETYRPEIVQLSVTIDKNAQGLGTLSWTGEEPSMAVVDYGTDSTSISHYLYSASEKYVTDHEFVFIDVPDTAFYFRIRQHYPDGGRQSTPFFRYSGQIVSDNGPMLRILMVNLGTQSGDCIYLEMPGGTRILIDSGTREAVPVITDALDREGDRNFDWFLGTHDHADHTGGFRSLSDGFRFSNLIIPDHIERDYYISSAASTVRNAGGTVYEVSAGDNSSDDEFLHWDDDVSVEVWSSGAGDDFPSITYDGSRINNDSPLLKISYGDFTFVTGGDSENEVHQKYVNDIPDLDAETDVYKASHHGRTDSNDRPFLERIDPQTVLISTYDDGTCAGLFQCATLPIFHAVQADVFRTDCASPELNRTSPNTKKNAHIHCLSDGVYYVVKTK